MPTFPSRPPAKPPSGGGCSRRRWARSPCSRSRALGLAATLRGDEPKTPDPPAAKPEAAVPYDFDGDGRLELVASVLRASPRGSHVPSGVVMLRRGDTAGTSSPRRTPGCRAARAAPTSSAPGSPAATSTATAPPTSRSGRPGRNRVSVLYGTGHGLAGGRQTRSCAAREGLRLRPRRTRPGRRRLRRPARRRARGAARSAGQRAPAPRRAGRAERPPHAVLERPASAATVGFGTRLRLGDVDGDHRVDLVEGGPPRPPMPGHATFCRGSSSGPRRCRAFGGTDGTSGLAVGDVNHDGYADVVQGDSEADQPAGPPASSGCGSGAAAGRGRRRSSSTRTRARSRGRTSRETGSGRSWRPATSTWTATPT